MKRLREQIEVLAAEYGIGIDYIECGEFSWFVSAGNLASRRIEVPAIDDERSYFTALHEIGHIVLGMPTYEEGSSEPSLDNEVVVWAWALGKAIIKLEEPARGWLYGGFMGHVYDSAARSDWDAIRRLKRVFGVEEWQ
jgi:hypothetical protein